MSNALTQKLLLLYSGVLTVALAGALLARCAPTSRTARFDEIDVGRINVREPDGTIRLVISSTAKAPGIIVRNREQPHPDRRTAGLLFFNDEGTENGGLIFGGRMRDGRPESSGSLTFDRYEQDQVVQLLGDESGGERRGGVAVYDRPDARFDWAGLEHAGRMPQGSARDAAYRVAGAGGVSRGFFGREADRSSQLVLRDGAGRKRLVLRVADDGAARIDFLDPGGKVVRSVTP